MKPARLRSRAVRLVKQRRWKATRQCSCRIVPCSRSTNPLVQACRGLVRVWRRPRALLGHRGSKICSGLTVIAFPQLSVWAAAMSARETRGFDPSRLFWSEKIPC
jgi:hypothetical protein